MSIKIIIFRITLTGVLPRPRDGSCLLESSSHWALQIFGSLEPLPAGERGQFSYDSFYPVFYTFCPSHIQAIINMFWWDTLKYKATKFHKHVVCFHLLK